MTSPHGHPDAERVLADAPTQLFLGGAWRDAEGGATMPVEDPATGEVIARVADATVADGAAALDAAVAAQASWAAPPPQERSEILYRAFQLMQERTDDLALLMTLEMGKSLTEAQGEIAYAAEFFRWNSGEALRLDGYVKDTSNGQSRVLVLKQPVGPCLFITPWNFPAAMGTRKIAPAIAAGCTMVVKPAEQTPLSMLALARLLADAGLPEGVLNVVPTSRAADVTGPLIQDPRLRKLSFTGSTEVGRTLIAQAADQVLKVSMELGGNAPFLVFDDADLDTAVEGAMAAKMRNMGEACTAANRFYVHASVAEEFSARLAERMSALTVGHGAEDGTDVGPLIDADQRGKVVELVRDAIDKGATAVVGGGPRDGAGYFYEPTVLTGITDDARLLREEVFGPVAPISTFTDEDDAVARANDTTYGLVSYLFTRDLDRALRVAERLETGMVGLNQGIVSNAGAPFGGVKQSGLGREGGNEGIAEFLETKYVAIKR